MAYLGQHRNVVPLLGVVTRSAPLFLVMPLCSDGSLLSYLHVCGSDVRKALSNLDKLTMVSVTFLVDSVEGLPLTGTVGKA